jgi:hypothetical protein
MVDQLKQINQQLATISTTLKVRAAAGGRPASLPPLPPPPAGRWPPAPRVHSPSLPAGLTAPHSCTSPLCPAPVHLLLTLRTHNPRPPALAPAHTPTHHTCQPRHARHPTPAPPPPASQRPAATDIRAAQEVHPDLPVPHPDGQAGLHPAMDRHDCPGARRSAAGRSKPGARSHLAACRRPRRWPRPALACCVRADFPPPPFPSHHPTHSPTPPTPPPPPPCRTS